MSKVSARPAWSRTALAVFLALGGPSAGGTATLVPPPASHTLGFDRVTSRQVAIALPGVPFGSPAGIAVVRLDATNDSKSSKDDDEVTVVVVDSETGLVLSNGRGIRALVWGEKPGAIGSMKTPRDIAIDRAGRIAVSDTGNRRVVVLHHDGERLEGVRAFEGFGEPRGVAADGRGGFYICDRAANRVVRLDAATGKRDAFGLELGFDRPIAIATVPEGDKLTRGKKRRVAVVDRDGARLRLFTIEGGLVAGCDASASGPSDARFDDVDFDLYGNVFAVDHAGSRLHKFREDLIPLDVFGRRGTERGEFLGPRGIAIHRSFGQVFVTEEGGGRYLWIGTDVKSLVAETRGKAVAFSFRLTEESLATLRILDASGKAVATLFDGDRQSAGEIHGTWDGSAENGGHVPPGEYVIEVRARATYSSKSIDEARATVRVRLGGRS